MSGHEYVFIDQVVLEHPIEVDIESDITVIRFDSADVADQPAKLEVL